MSESFALDNQKQDNSGKSGVTDNADEKNGDAVISTKTGTSGGEFEEDPPRRHQNQGQNQNQGSSPIRSADDMDVLLLNIDGYEGPIDVLLELARKQKVDLAKISILQLVRQYLLFIDRAKEHSLDLAAEYLVMAAWLTYLKSRLFLPKTEETEEPGAEEMALALQFQLRRLEAMQKAAEKLADMPRLGQKIFARGQPEDLKMSVTTNWDVSLYDILKAYGSICKRREDSTYDLPTFSLMSSDEAKERLCRMLGNLPRKGRGSVWTTLHSFLPDDGQEQNEAGPQHILYKRSALASTFTAGLELAKQGDVEIRQDGLFRPVYLRALPRIYQAENIENNNTHNN